VSDTRERVLAGIDQRLADSSPAAMDYRTALQFAREEIEQHNRLSTRVRSCVFCGEDEWPCRSIERAARLFLGENA
jgi:hypothetical protein